MKADNEKLESRIFKVSEDGKQCAKELLRENEQLRLQIASLENEKRELESRSIHADVSRLQERVKLLEDENESLKSEVRELSDQCATTEKANWEFADRCIEVERQNSNLINMYVSSFRLHSTLDFDKVLQTMKEIIINLIGSEWFDIYLLDPKESRLVLVASEGWKVEPEIYCALDRYDVLAEVLKTGKSWVVENDKVFDKKGEGPVACIPLKAGGKILGIVFIRELLIQKEGFQALDRTLIELLGEQSATAILGAILCTYSDSEAVFPRIFNKVKERKLQNA